MQTVLAVSTLNMKVIYCSTEKNEINGVFADGQSLPSISLHQCVCGDSSVNFPSAHPVVLNLQCELIEFFYSLRS